LETRAGTVRETQFRKPDDTEYAPTDFPSINSPYSLAYRRIADDDSSAGSVYCYVTIELRGMCLAGTLIYFEVVIYSDSVNRMQEVSLLSRIDGKFQPIK
jgi:hypothetical protein